MFNPNITNITRYSLTDTAKGVKCNTKLSEFARDFLAKADDVVRKYNLPQYVHKQQRDTLWVEFAFDSVGFVYSPETSPAYSRPAFFSQSGPIKASEDSIAPSTTAPTKKVF